MTCLLKSAKAKDHVTSNLRIYMNLPNLDLCDSACSKYGRGPCYSHVLVPEDNILQQSEAMLTWVKKNKKGPEGQQNAEVVRLMLSSKS